MAMKRLAEESYIISNSQIRAVPQNQPFCQTNRISKLSQSDYFLHFLFLSRRSMLSEPCGESKEHEVKVKCEHDRS